MQWFSYHDKREVLQQEYSQLLILPSPHFRWVVKTNLPSVLLETISEVELFSDVSMAHVIYKK